jgi:hypothetical protein
MLTFLFWNTNRKPLADRVARIVRAHAVDVVILAECEFGPTDLEQAATTLGTEQFQCVSHPDKQLRVWSRIAEATWQLGVDDLRWLIFRIKRPRTKEILLVVAHLPSKLHAGPADQQITVRRLVGHIEDEEKRRRHTRTIVVGDLNMNPFEEGMAGAGHLHAVMTRKKAGEESRVISGQNHGMFYNPMWGLFGDRTAGPAGTYYASSTGAVSYFWEMFDQILLRPAVMNLLTELAILDSDGIESLLTKDGLPDQQRGSDHLPVLFRLDV